MASDFDKFNAGQMSDNNYDAFSAGVELGGLRNASQIKTLIGYLVKKVDSPIQRSKIVGILQIHGIANYFTSSEALEELVESGCIECNDDGMLSITEKGKIALFELEDELPKSVREKALNDAIRLQTMERRESENKIDIEYLEKGANVTFTICNGDDTLMKLTVYAADDNQISLVKSNFLKDPVSLYAGIVSTLFA